MRPWEDRPLEEANLFNPAYCGALLYEFLKAYQAAKRVAVPFILPFSALPIALHPKTRSALPTRTTTSLYSWLEDHTDTLVGLGSRASNLTPYVQEAVRFAIDHATITINKDGELQTGPNRAAFTPKNLELMTPDVRECVFAVRLLGRWFAAAGKTTTILSSWGLRP